MVPEPDFITSILTTFANIFRPLQQALRSTSEFSQFLQANFGWSPSDADCSSLISELEAVVAAVTRLSTDSPEEVLVDIPAITVAIRDLQAAATTAGATVRPILQSLSKELLPYLLSDYCLQNAPRVFGVAHALGVFAEARVPADSLTGRDAYLRHDVYWARLGQSLIRPESVIQEVYGWGTTLQHEHLLGSVGLLLQGFGASAGLYPATADLLDVYFAMTAPTRATLKYLAITPIQIQDRTGSLVVGFKASLVGMPIPPVANNAADPDGIAIFPLLIGNVADTFKIGASATITLSGGFESKPIYAEIHPGSTKVRVAVSDSPLAAKAQLTAAAPTGSPWTLLGSSHSTHIEAGGVAANLSASGPSDQIVFSLGFTADPIALVIDFADSDGFLQHFFGDGVHRTECSIQLGWSSRDGFNFNGSGSLETVIPIHSDPTGAVNPTAVHLRLGAGRNPDSASLTAGLDCVLSLGPVIASISSVGLSCELDSRKPPDPPGNLGDADLTFGFKPPDGIGIAVDAAVLTGGGSVLWDTSDRRYLGQLSLSFQDFRLMAMAIIETGTSGASPQFSFFILASAQFTPALDLPYGFTLDAVGGLAGLERTIVKDSLQAKLKDPAFDSILFPADPIEQAPQIIAAVESIFPPADGCYVFGPVVELGWGSPTLVTIKLGVILELPKERVVILGIITSELPNHKDAQVVIHIDVLGVIDFKQRKLAIDATLHDSRVLSFALLGDMALRLAWGDSPTFALSLGGFNPKFDLNQQGLSDFPSLQRLHIGIGSGSGIQVSLDCYLAITTNTVQFGADLELIYNMGSISVHGWLAFDALVDVSVMQFTVDMRAGVEIRWHGHNLFGVGLDLTLVGARPLKFSGSARISICHIHHSIHISGTLVEGQKPTLPTVEVLPPLETALSDIRNWSGTLPTWAMPAVAFVQPTLSPGTIAVDPASYLSAMQNVVPLDTPINRFRGGSPQDGSSFHVELTVTATATDLTVQPVIALFAAGQFVQMSDEQKLAAPAYQGFPAGARLGVDQIDVGQGVPLDLNYDIHIIDDPVMRSSSGGTYAMPSDVQQQLVGMSVGAHALARTSGLDRFVATGLSRPVSSSDAAFVIASSLDLTVRKDILDPDSPLNSPHALTQLMATATLNAYLAAHLDQASDLQVIPRYEAAAA